MQARFAKIRMSQRTGLALTFAKQAGGIIKHDRSGES